MDTSVVWNLSFKFGDTEVFEIEVQALYPS